MNEDEAFIRAIVDGPGDDTARLVYADWLDDRADPRGAYLRAEAEWAKPWRNGTRPADNPALRELGAALDGVWLARVSRPPVGVCCDHMGIAKSSVQLRSEDLDQIERSFALTLPTEYRAFLLNYNGGRSKLNSLPHPVYDGIDCELQRWNSLMPAQEPLRPENVLWQIRYYRTASEPSFHAIIPLCAADAGYYETFAIGCGKENAGRVYYVMDFSLSPDAGEPLEVANSLGYFLASIQNWVEPSVFNLDEDSDRNHKPQAASHE